MRKEFLHFNFHSWIFPSLSRLHLLSSLCDFSSQQFPHLTAICRIDFASRLIETRIVTRWKNTLVFLPESFPLFFGEQQSKRMKST